MTSSTAGAARATPGAPPSAAARAAATGSAALAARQALIAVVSVAAVGTLTALLAPSDFALYGYATTIFLVAAGIGDLGAAAGIILREVDDARVPRVAGLQVLVWGALGVAGIGVVALTGAYGLRTPAAVAFAAAFVLLCLQTVPTAKLERDLRFVAVAGLEVLQRVVFVGIVVGVAVAGGSAGAVPVGILVCAALGYLGALALTGGRVRMAVPRRGDGPTSFAAQWWRGRVLAQLNYAVYPVLGGLLLGADDIGLVLWALAVTQVPALLAPMAARALLPSMAGSSEVDKVAVSITTLRAILVVSLPIVAVLAGCAEPLVDHVLGSQWARAVPLLRLECVTTTLGFALTIGGPLCYLVLEPARVTRVLALWLVIAWVGTAALVPLLGRLAPSVAVIVAAGLALLLLDRMLRRATGASLIAVLRAPVVALGIAVLVGVVLGPLADGAATTTALAVLVAVVQVVAAVAVGGADDVRLLGAGVRRFLRQGLRATALRR